MSKRISIYLDISGDLKSDDLYDFLVAIDASRGIHSMRFGASGVQSVPVKLIDESLFFDGEVEE